MAKNMETTGIIWGICRDYRDYMGFIQGDNGKEHGNDYLWLRVEGFEKKTTVTIQGFSLS